MKQSTIKKNGISVVEIGWVCILVGLFVWLYVGAPSVTLWLALAVGVGLALFSVRCVRMRALDWCVFFLLAFEVPSVVFSQYRANSVRPAGAVAISVLVYFAMRLTICTSSQIAVFSGLLGVCGAWLGVNAVRQFHTHATAIQETGLTDLVAFRSKLMSAPAPWVLGEWLTVLLLTLPFACAFSAYLCGFRKRWLIFVSLLVPLPILAALSLSLSRAVFWSTVLFCIAVCGLMAAYHVSTLRTSGVLLASAVGALALLLACQSAIYPGIWKAYTGQHTSQIRSTQGRIGIWNRSFELVRAHPFWGVGSSNAALFLMSSSDQEETTGFASRTFSLPVQVFVEKGCIGFLLYATFLVLVGREFTRTMRFGGLRQATSFARQAHRNVNELTDTKGQPAIEDEAARRAMACCFGAGLIAVLFRELTYSSVLEHTLTLLLVLVLSALICLPEGV